MSTFRANIITDSPGTGAPTLPNGLRTTAILDTVGGNTVQVNGDVALNRSTNINRGVSVNSTSGTAIDFTGIPSWARRITVALDGVSLSGTDALLLQIGDSGGIETTGYISGAAHGPSTNMFGISNSGFLLNVVFNALAPDAKYGALTLSNYSGNSWVMSGVLHSAGYQVGNFCAGAKALSDVLDRVRILSSGANTFDGGVINIMWE